MGIEESEFPTIWRAIREWLRQKGRSPDALASYTNTSRERILRGIDNGREWIDSKFLHDCVEFLGFQFHRGFDEDVEVLSDEECIDYLISSLNES
ncbi:MAG: hypothetical protein PHR56_01180 [Dehalococcoidales bacterium]|nr:hypothetical protein [Dehalococcoidales bacterium]